MSSYAGPAAPRPQDIVGSLRLLGYLALALILMLADHRGGWLHRARQWVDAGVQPLWKLAGLPAQLGDRVRSDAVSRAQLAHDNRILRNALLVSGARVARLEAAAAENERLRAMLGAARQGGLDVQLVPILDIDLDPTRQRLVLDAGSRQGVSVGQAVIDAGGLLGQVIEVQPATATVLLLTDPDHAVPVEVARNGVRLVAYGQGDRIALQNVPRSADLRVGDVIRTSGLGLRFPPGFAVGTVTELAPDDSRAFITARLRPAAGLDRGREVLLLREVRAALAPAPPAMPATDTVPVPGAPRSAAALGAANRNAPQTTPTPTVESAR